MENKGEIAYNLFKSGYNCSQAVACAFAEELGLSVEKTAMLMSAFGGGFGRSREVCGAVSGMTMVAGSLFGYSDPTAAEDKMALYALEQRLLARFKEENGSIICRELLGLQAGEAGAVPAERTAAYYQKRPCAELCRIAAEIIEEEINNGGTK